MLVTLRELSPEKLIQREEKNLDVWGKYKKFILIDRKFQRFGDWKWPL